MYRTHFSKNNYYVPQIMYLKFLKSAISSCEPSLWNNNPPSFYEINKFFATL